jgi:hypothetical protein
MASLAGMLLLDTSCGVIKPDGVMDDILSGKAKPPTKEEEDARRDLHRQLCSQLNEDPSGMTFKIDF